jgi:hypothetical protein
MVLALQNPGSEDPPKADNCRHHPDQREAVTWLCDNEFQTVFWAVVTSRLISSNWSWDVDSNLDYLKAEEIVRALRVTNDTAERGVAMIQEYSGLLTKSEEQTQFLLQVVAEHRKLFPNSNSNKMTVLHGLSASSSQPST